jgi:hypothetical protein
VVHQDPEPLERYLDWPCAHVEEVLRRGMSKDRAGRYPSAMDFARALEEALAQDLGYQRVSAPALRLLTPPRGLGSAPGEAASSVKDTLQDAPRTWHLETVRLMRPRLPRPRVTGSLAGLAAVALAVLYLDTVGWENVGNTVGGAYQQAVAATSRTVARFRNPIPTTTTVVAPETRHGAEIVPLPSVPALPAQPDTHKAAPMGIEAAARPGAGSLP